MTDCQRWLLSANRIGSNKKGGCREEKFKGSGNSLEDVKREALKRFGWRRSLRGYAALRRLGAAMSCL